MTERYSSNANLTSTNLPPSRQGFYVIGGTLPGAALSYVTRQADHQLYEGLCQGQFCYVLTSRQMGKSSLMIRTSARLREAGIKPVVLDLTAIGQNLTAEQWYDGLLSRMGIQLQIEDELEDFWLDHPRLGPLQRWMTAIREIVLPRFSNRLVIFVDEIDTVRSLPFSTDEFFAGIREFYNRRTAEPELERLTFCLLGVAAPSDLIQDTRTTPFNIGRRIELQDFTREEAAPLAEGLWREGQKGTDLLERVLYWTNGHPYLTQRLCQTLAEFPGAQNVGEVDRKCAELFLVEGAQTTDDNLLFVRERILRSEVEISSLLTLYEQTYRKRKVLNDETSPIVTTLRLSGLTRVEDGQLRVRNRIYERSFNRQWIKDNLPDAELRRQRAAYRQGLLRAGAIAAAILVVVTSLALIAWQQRNRAREQEQINHQQLYAAQMSLAGQAWEASNLDRMTELLNFHLPQPGRQDLRGFEWYLLHRLGHNNLPVGQHNDIVRTVYFTPDSGKMISVGMDKAKLLEIATGREMRVFDGQQGKVWVSALSRDGEILATGGENKTVKLWEVATGKELLTIREQYPIYPMALSPDGKTLATADSYRGDRTVIGLSIKLWDTATGKELASLKGHKKWPFRLIFAPDGKRIATTSHDGLVKLWEVATGKELFTFGKENTTPLLPMIFAAFSSDGKKLATNNMEGTDLENLYATKIWDTTTGKELVTVGKNQLPLAFSPDGKQLVTMSGAEARLWEVATGQERFTLRGHSSFIEFAVFSPDGQQLATGGGDYFTKLWEVSTGQELATLKGHTNALVNAAFSPDSRWLATASADKTARLWDVGAGLQPFIIRGNGTAVAFSPDSQKLGRGSIDGAVSLWDVRAGKERFTVKGHSRPIEAVAFSPDGKMMGTASYDLTAKLWEVATGKELVTFKGHTEEISKMIFTPDSKQVVTAGIDRTYKLWDVATGKELASGKGHTGNIQAMSLSPDGKLLVTGSDDRTARFWEVAAGRELFSYKGDDTMIYAVAFSPDGRTLALAGENRLIKLLDVTTRQEIRTFKGHNSSVWSLAFSPDGQRLASGSTDNHVKLWNVATGQELLTFSEANRVAFSPDGIMLATSKSEGQFTKLWRIATSEKVASQIAKEARAPNK